MPFSAASEELCCGAAWTQGTAIAALSMEHTGDVADCRDRSSASRSPTRMPTPFTAVRDPSCGRAPPPPSCPDANGTVLPTVDKAVEYILSQPDAS